MAGAVNELVQACCSTASSQVMTHCLWFLTMSASTLLMTIPESLTQLPVFPLVGSFLDSRI